MEPNPVLFRDLAYIFIAATYPSHSENLTNYPETETKRLAQRCAKS